MSEEVKQTTERAAGRGRGRKPAGDGAAGNEMPQRPKTAARSGRRGGAQADGAAAPENNDGVGRGRGRRPQTARQAANAAEGQEETKGEAKGEAAKGEAKGGDRGNNRGGRGGRGRGGDRQNNDRAQTEKKQDKNSWIYKYHNMERVEYPKIKFTAETEVPELPSKKDRLTEPQKNEFDREMAQQDHLIQAGRTKKDDLIKKRQSVREGGRRSGENRTRKGELTDKITTARSIRSKKQSAQANMRQVSDEINKLEGDKKELLKTMHKSCHTVDDVNNEIKDLERMLTTTTMKPQDESKLIKEINQLKNSVPMAKKLTGMEPAIKELRAQKNVIYGEIKEIRKEEDVLNAEMEAIRKELAQTDVEKDETNAKVEVVQVQIVKVEEELNALYSKKDEMREAYWKGRFDFKVQQNEIQHTEWMQRQKERIVNNAAMTKEREDDKKAFISSLPHPYVKEIDICDHLVSFLTQQKVRMGLLVSNEDAARAAQTAMQKEVVQERLHEKLSAGKVQVSQSKAEREAANTVQYGGQKKQKGKKRREVVEQYEEFNLDFAIIKKLATLGISPPSSADDLDKTLEQVEGKKQWYEENGGIKLQEQIDQLEREAAEEQKFYEADTQDAEEEPTRGGRGGRGRGGYRGGRGGTSGRGRGRGGMSSFQAKGEFDGEDDDDIAYSAPVKAPKMNKQKKEDLQMDEANYPAL